MKRLVITTTSLSFCSLMFSNCASIKELREREDPYSTVKKTKVAKTAPKQKKGGFFAFFKNLREEPKDNTIPTKKRVHTADTLAKKTVTYPTKATPAPAIPSNYNSLPTLPTKEVRKQASTAVKGQVRRPNGLMTPDAGKLPSNKDLQEVQAPSSRQKGTPGVNIPTQP